MIDKPHAVRNSPRHSATRAAIRSAARHATSCRLPRDRGRTRSDRSAAVSASTISPSAAMPLITPTKIWRRLVDDAFDFRCDGDGKIPGGQPLPQSRSVPLIDAQADEHQRPLGLPQPGLNARAPPTCVARCVTVSWRMTIRRDARSRRQRLRRFPCRQREIRHADTDAPCTHQARAAPCSAALAHVTFSTTLHIGR